MVSIIVNAIGFILSIFLGSLLLIANRLNQRINLLMGGLLLLFSIFILNSLRALVMGPDYFKGFEILSNYLILLVGPLLYLIAKQFEDNSKTLTQDALHFIPFVGFFTIGIITMTSSTYIFSILEVVTVLFLVLSLFVYLFIAIRITYTKKVDFTIKFAIVGFTAMWIFNLIIQFLEYYTEHVKEEAQIWSTLLLSVLVIILTYSYWIEILKEVSPIKSKLELSKETRKTIMQKIDREFTSRKPYLDGQFSLQRLSELIDEPTSYISKVINNEMGVSFPLYIAKLRVDEFIRIAPLQENQNLTIKSISEKVGFNSSSTFNKAFKAHTSMLPSAYLKSLKNL